MKLHIVVHESFEAPGAIDTWVQNKGHAAGYTRLYEGDSLPRSIDGIDFLVVMGGPQSPATTKEECPHFDAAAEVTFIRTAVNAGRKVLGICLGAQLVGEALGAPFEHSPHKEIGVFPVTLTAEAAGDPVFSTFPGTFPVGHWHGDMPGLSPESKVLAASEGCPRQIVRYTPRVYGFQCHFDFTRNTIEGMIENCGHELEQSGELPYIQSAKELRANDCDSFNALLFSFMDYMESLD